VRVRRRRARRTPWRSGLIRMDASLQEGRSQWTKSRPCPAGAGRTTADNHRQRLDPRRRRRRLDLDPAAQGEDDQPRSSVRTRGRRRTRRALHNKCRFSSPMTRRPCRCCGFSAVSRRGEMIAASSTVQQCSGETYTRPTSMRDALAQWLSRRRGGRPTPSGSFGRRPRPAICTHCAAWPSGCVGSRAGGRRRGDLPGGGRGRLPARAGPAGGVAG
jgi:hypothetical protein